MSKMSDYLVNQIGTSADYRARLDQNIPEPEDNTEYVHDATGISDGVGGFLANLLMPGFSTALYRPSVQNFVGGLEGDAGGAANYLGAALKALDEQGRASSLSDDIQNADVGPLGSLGDWFINNGTYWNDRANDVQQQFGTLNRYQNEDILQRLTDTDYLTDSRGLMADVFNGAGSSVPFVVASSLAPEIGIGGALARGAGGLLERLGMSTAGRAVASDLVQSGANDFARYALTGGPLEAAINAGGIYDDLKNQGLSDSEIFGKMNSMIGEELPMDMLTSGLYGAVLGGNTFSRLGQGGWKRAIGANILNTPADMLGEYVQEMTQQQLQNKYSGKPYGTFWNPTEDEMQAGRAAAMGTLPMGLFGSARGAMHSRRAAMAAEGGGSVTGPEPVTPPAVPDPDVDPVEAAQLTGKNDDVPTADGIDVTDLDQQQYTQWYGDKLKSQGIDVPDATITVQTPQATGTTGGAKAGAGANVMDAAQDFMGQHMENGANGCVEAVTKIGARYNPFLADELSKGVVNVDTLVADAGDKVIPFDPNNLEAGDVIVYDNNDHVVLYDGNGGYVGNSSSQQKVVQGGDYNNMGGLKPTKIIKTGNGVTAQNAQETTNNGGAPAADLSSLPVGDIATAIAQNTGLPANFIWAQLSHESDGGNSKLAREDHNYGGVKGNDGEYLHFDNDQQFIDYMSNYYPKYREDGIYDAQTADQFAEALQHGGYFTADLGEYEGGMHRYLEQAGLSDSGTAGAPAEKQSTVNTMTQQQFGDMLNEKMIDFAGTNDDTVKTVFNDMSTSKDKALVSLFAPYMQDGVFANTAANRTALVNNDGFKKAMTMFLSKHLSDYAPAFENGRISFQQAEDALRPRHQQDAQATQTVQAPNIQTATTPQALIQMVQKGLNREQQGAILQAANTALHTPQGMANGDEAVWMNKLAKAIDEHDYPTIAQMIPNESMQALSAPKQGAPISMANTVMNPVGQTETEQAQFTQNAPANVVAMPAAQAPTNADTKNRVSSKVQGDAPVRQQATAERQAPQSEVASTVQGNTPVQQTATTENEMPQSKVASTVEATFPAKQAPVRMNNQRTEQQAAPEKQSNVTPLPTQETQQSEGVRIAQPQPTIDEQNAQMDARIAAIKKQPLAQRKALGQQYLDTLRQNNVSFSEKKLAKSLMDGDPEAIEHVQRTYGDLLNTITPAEAAAASQQTTPRTVHAIRAARLNGMMNEIAKGSTFKNASTMQKLAYLMTANSHAGMLRDQGKLDTIHNTIDKVRADAGLTGSGLTDGMTKEQRDSLYYETIKQQLDDEAAIRKEATDEDSDSLRGIDNDIKLLMRELADSRQKVKAARKENTNESTQSESQRTQDEGAKNQDQHAEPEPRKAADTQRKAEESEVSATKKAADKGGRDEQTLSEKEVVLKHISTLFGKPITNKETGIVATFGTKGANKMVSNKAVDKTVKNGYSQHEHLEAVKDIKRLYEDAGLSVQHEDRDKSPNILSIKRFRTNMTTVDGNPATAKITVKETKQNGHKIYSIELEALEKPSELNHARADSSEGQTVRPTKGKQPSSAYADESSSSTHIIPHEQKEGTKNLDSGNHHEMVEKHSQNGDTVDVVLEAQRDGVPSNLADYVRGVTREDVASIPDKRKKFIDEAINTGAFRAIETDRGGYMLIGTKGGMFSSVTELTPAETVYYAMHGGLDFNKRSTKEAIMDDLATWYGSEKPREIKSQEDNSKETQESVMGSDAKNTTKESSIGEPIHGIKGTETTVVTDSGKEIRVRYLVVPASRVITSHDAETMVPNKSYPQELQPRDRQRVSMQEQVTTMANELRPADLGAGRNLNQGAPIIRKDGVVLNGNGRAMAIQKATAAGGDKATAYRKYIFEHSKEFGLSRSSLAQLRKYMLVREVVDDIDADTMQDIIGSTAGGSRMGASEQAKADAKKIKPRDLDSYVDNEQGDLTTAANQDFVARVLYRIVGKNERNAYTDEHGNVNADGIQRVKRALFSLAYNDDGLIDKMAESTDDNIRNVSRGLMSAAPAFARVNLAVKDGQAYEYDAGKTISDAVKHLDALRREGKPVKDYLNEQSMFSEYQDTDEVREVLRFFDENKRSGKKIGIFLNDMARSILEQGSPNQTSLMDGGRATLGEIIKSAERVAHDGTTAASLFDNAQEAPAEEKPEEATNEKKDESIFGSVEDADKEMLDALGLSEEDLADDVLTAPSGIKNTAEEREKLEKELAAELNKLSANPVFNPKIYTLGLKLAMTYVKDGINTVKKLVAKLNAKFGDKIGPWAPALAETVRTWPKGVPFDEKKVMAISKAVGARYESGITSLDDMQADMKKLLKGQHDSFAPMIEASYNGIRKFFEAQKGENDHVDDSTSGLAERAGRGSDSDRVGPDDAGGESGRRSGRGVQEVEEAVQPEGGARVRDRSAAAGGEAGNRGIQAEESGDRAGSAGSAHVSRSVRDSYEGSVGHDADRNAADIKPAQNRRDNASPAGARARAVKPNKSHKQGDLGSIKNDLPMLKPEQQEDVEFIETRVNVNNKPGVMLTNGTGTGKTYSGLGFVKRMYDAGKKNILIVSPSESINDQWIEAASKHFDLSIEKLDSTKDSGKDGGICITTYANLQANKELVNRNWDAVVSDESHTLMQNEKGGETGYLSMLRALTLNPRGAYKRFKLQHRTKEIRSLENQIEEREKKAKAILRPYKDKKKVSSADKAKVDALQKEIESLNKEMEGIFWKMSPGTDKLMQDLKAAYPEEKRPKVLFLSATPFAHDKDIDYAEGYLFNYEEDAGRYGGYNQGTPSDRFMMKHFGYRMRYNKLTRPDAEVDSRAMEVQFHDDLVNSGAMHGRQIDVDKDYDRGFILVDGGIGHKIDEGFKFLSDNHAAYGELHQALMKQFNKSQQKYLIESIKAREVIPLIQEYVKKGKKVVLFHQSMVEHKNIHPFQLKPSADLAENSEVWAQWKAFKSARPDLVNLSLGNIPAPMETLRKELGGHAVFINGSVLKKDRAKNIEQFNDDNSGVNIIVCQQDAANAGISLHDTTGKHPRVLINIAMPERPSYAMQIEGRIYRVGNASNAVFRYLSTGTDIEKNMFASTIGGRAASVENLAVGNAARGLRESFRDLYQETMDGSWKRRLPGAEGEGTGGKEMDYAVTADLSEYDRAKSFYFAHQKRTSRTKAQEGNDYFATPEPIGYKMVEWLGLKSGEKALEPSAGHGAISRWFPETTERTIVEPSGKLMPLAQMNTPGAKTVHGSFEDFNIVNKFDGIAMNPPYGTGGKTAIEHLQKAFKQLHDGGRVVAIIPEGPAADKRYSKMMEEISSEVVPIADIHLPAVAFSRAGTKVGTHIVVLDRYTGKAAHQAALDHFGGADDIDLRGIDSINDLFDRMENMAMPERYDASNVRKAEPAPTPAVQLDEARVEGVPDETPNFTADEYEHTKTHEVKFRARPKSFLGENYRPIQKLAKAHGGYYSKFAKNSFLFEDEDERNAFLQEAEALLSDGKASAKGSVAEMVKHIEFPAADTLTEREKAMQEFGQQMGVRVVFFDGPANLRGFYNKGITFINRSASKSPSWVFWHENLHWLRSNNPELYRQMVDYISGRQELSPEQLQAYRDAIGRPELTDADTIEEMLADAMPDVHKRVDLFRKMGRENKSLIQRFFGWLRDTMAAFHNAFSQPKYGLSKTQAQAMRNALANIAEDLRDGEGRRIFRTRGADREILTAQGEELSYPVPDDSTKYSADKRDTEPAGSPGRMRHALVKLGLSTEQLKNVELRQAKGKQLDDISGWDMLAKSVRQVARKSPAVQYIYRLGRKALDEQEHLRNFYAQEIRKFNQYVKNPKILEEVAQLLWEGDATGHAYTGDELQAMGVSVEAGRAYNLVRRVLADAYKRVNEARMQVKVRTEVIGRNDYREFIASHFLKPEDVLKAEMLRNGSMRVTYRGAKVYSKNEEVVSPDVYNRLRKDKDVYIKYAEANEDGTYTIGYTERVKPIHNLEGYMPHFFHHFMVYEKTKGDDGKEILVSLGSANSLKKATDLANQYAKANPKGQFVIRPHSFEYDEDYNNVVVGDKDYVKMMMQITKHTEMTLPEANAFLHDSVGVTKKGRHRFFGNAQHRKGAKGFDRDVQWALTHYLNASARYVAMEHFKPEAISFYERFFGDFNAEPKSNTARYIKNFINDMNGVPSYIEDELNKIVANIPFFGSRLNDAFEGRPALALSSSISWFNAVTKLGLGNFASAAINFMQFINIGTRLNSYAYANMGLKKALKPSDFDRRIIEESGVMDEINLASDAGGYTQTRDYGRARKGLSKVKKGLDLAMIPFTKADSLMRKAAILGAYYQGVQEKGMKPEHEGEISRKAIEYAKDVNYDANFDYSTAAAPGAMRAGSVLTQQLFQFQKYPIMQFEFFWNNVVHAENNKQRARFLVPYLLMSGAVGAVPFGALINAVASSLVGAGGDDDNDLAEEIKAEMMKWAGTDPMKRRLVNTVLYGILANANINISERVGMSNAFSGEYYGNKPESSAGALLQLLGGPLVSTAYNVATQIGNHNPIETIKAVSPSLGNMLQAVVGETRTTHHRVGTVYDDMYSRVMHALGFRSVDETNNSFVNSYLYKQQKQAQEDRKDAMDAYIRDPSSENRQRMTSLGVTDKTFKTYKENANKSSKERSQGEKKTKSKKPQTEAQKESSRLKDFTK